MSVSSRGSLLLPPAKGRDERPFQNAAANPPRFFVLQPSLSKTNDGASLADYT